MRGRARTEKSVFYTLLWTTVAKRLNIGKFFQFPQYFSGPLNCQPYIYIQLYIHSMYLCNHLGNQIYKNDNDKKHDNRDLQL